MCFGFFVASFVSTLNFHMEHFGVTNFIYLFPHYGVYCLIVRRMHNNNNRIT